MNAMIRLNPAVKRKPVDLGEHKRVALRAHTALAEMINGTARIEEWQDLSESVNIVEALRILEKVPAEGLEAAVQAAIDGLMVAIKCPNGMMRMGAASTAAMRHVVTLHDDAVGRLSRGTLYEALELVTRRIYDPAADESTGLFVVNA